MGTTPLAIKPQLAKRKAMTERASGHRTTKRKAMTERHQATARQSERHELSSRCATPQIDPNVYSNPYNYKSLYLWN